MMRNLLQVRSLVTQVPKGEVEKAILDKLQEKFGYNLFHAEVRNTSWKNDKPKGSETHLELIVVASEFEGVKKDKREELLKSLLSEEIKKTEEFKIQALAPTKWYDSNKRGLKMEEHYRAPPILGGKLKELARNFYGDKQQPQQ